MSKNILFLKIAAFLSLGLNSFSFGKNLIIPVEGPIDYVQECILRRGLKKAEAEQYDRVILAINTPGGQVDSTLEILAMLQKVNLETIAYIQEAISAGSFIAITCDRIFFKPNGIIGAAAVIDGEGKNLDKNMQAKIDSYLNAKIRTLTEKDPMRASIQRAMMDINFVLKWDGKVIKPAGELLTLTAAEAEQKHKEKPLLSEGTFETEDQLVQFLDSKESEIVYFSPTGFEEFAKKMQTLIPLLSGIGFFLLFLEFKTPGFGLMGLLGLGCLSLSFFVNFLAGFGGYEAWGLLFVGICCILGDLFFFGTLIVLFIGIVCLFLGLGLSGIDLWPGIDLSWGLFLQPFSTVLYSCIITCILIVIAWKLGLVRRGLNCFTLLKTINKTSQATLTENFIGRTGTTLTPLMPSGKIIIDGQICEAYAENEPLNANTPIIITGKNAFAWIVRKQ